MRKPTPCRQRRACVCWALGLRTRVGGTLKAISEIKSRARNAPIKKKKKKHSSTQGMDLQIFIY